MFRILLIHISLPLVLFLLEALSPLKREEIDFEILPLLSFFLLPFFFFLPLPGIVSHELCSFMQEKLILTSSV